MGRLLKVIGWSLFGLYVAALFALVLVSLPMGGWRALSVQTGSMVPAIRPGALVLVGPAKLTALRIGDVITYRSLTVPNKTITHRIVGFQPNGASEFVIVRGDANPIADPLVQPNQLVGRVVLSVPLAGKLIDVLHTWFGLVVLIYIPALIIVLYELGLLVQRWTAIEAAELTAKQLWRRAYVGKPVGHYSLYEPQHKAYFSAHIVWIVMGIGVFLLAVPAMRTFAQATSPASLAGNTIAARNPTQSGSNISNTTTITITNSLTQTSASGNASATNSPAASGAATNSNTTNIHIAVQNP